IEVFKVRAAEKGLLFTSIGPQEPIAVIGDQVKLYQVIYNLIENAIKYTAQGEISVEYQITCQTHLAQLQLSVEDTASGIEPSDLDSIFKPFYRSQQHQAVSGGSGLGLAICQDIVDRLNGRIGVRSKPGFGSQFWFELTFPLARKPSSSVFAGSAQRSA